ncbi:hypothetical protein VKT23_012561 [Stygiomarasmius scandens]|uniref:AAA+ ATPase domain-containing protein n=1 Tax=Marasmiellus scandens TaxID=2682957 RepID=A0ABR1JAF9_9AGAR
MGFYARFISIWNSSGTGKTKTVLELRNFQVPVVYINLRPRNDENNYPPRDNDIAELFDPDPYYSADDYYHACLKIFCALFERLLLDFDKPDQNIDNMIKSWNSTYTNDVSKQNMKRTAFFLEVKWLFNQMREDTLDSRARLQAVYKRLRTCLKSRKNFLVLALDEIHNIPDNLSARCYSPFRTLRQAFADFTEHSAEPAAWLIFLSTNPPVSHFAAPARIYSAQRAVIQGHRLFTPFSSLGWDFFAKEADVSSVGAFNNAISFGRPLWTSVSGFYSKPDDMTRFALSKLCHSRPGSELGKDALIALLSQRFVLDFVESHEDIEAVLNTAVANHMRFILSASQHYTNLYTSYPSEPVLSHAVAELMYLNPVNLIEALKSQFTSGLIRHQEKKFCYSKYLPRYHSLVTHCLTLEEL